MDRNYRFSFRSYSSLYQCFINIHRVRPDVDEDRPGPDRVDGVGRSDESMADGDDIAARPYPGSLECQVQRGGAVRDHAGVFGPDESSKRFFKRGGLRPLRYPPGAQHFCHSLAFIVTEERFGEGNHGRICDWSKIIKLLRGIIFYAAKDAEEKS